LVFEKSNKCQIRPKVVIRVFLK